MWQLINIKATNLCAFRTLDYTLQQDVTTLVFGHNMDNDSQGSNGAGKSAIIEAIAVGLTGEPLRKVKAEEIIRDDAEEAQIELTLQNHNSKIFKLLRCFSRRSPQEISVTMDKEVVTQASVADYNKYILDTIGLTKEDIYSNFILSKHRYNSFLSSSDRDKKELINRFSNGALVDESLKYLQADIDDVKKQYNKAETDASYANGVVATICKQIETIETKEEEEKATKTQKLQQISHQISEAREAIRKSNLEIRMAEQNWDDVEAVDKELQLIENTNCCFEEKYVRISRIWKPELLGSIADYLETVKDAQEQIAALKQQHTSTLETIKQWTADFEAAVSEGKKLSEDYATEKSELLTQKAALSRDVKEWEQIVRQATEKVNSLLINKSKESKRLSDLSILLSGAIECPKCHHTWVVNTNKSAEEIEGEIAQIQNSISGITESIESDIESSNHAKASITKAHADEAEIDSQLFDIKKVEEELQQHLSKLQSNLDNITENGVAINERILALNKRISTACHDMFDELYDKVDSVIRRCDTRIKSCESNIAALQGNIETLEKSQKLLESSAPSAVLVSLKESLTEANTRLQNLESNKLEIEERLNGLLAQEVRFAEFKTYLANTKIEALSTITNGFLSEIGSDIQVVFSGFTTLRSGQIREKISVTLQRDGIDCGSFGKFSQGERSRCELATILALQKLLNANCGESKGLDLLVIDEIMDGIDEDGLSNIFETLNKLQVTSLVVSHGLVQEAYQHKLVVKKENGVSFI